MIVLISPDYGHYTTHPGNRAARIISVNGPVDAPIVAVIRLTGEAEDLKGKEMLMCFNTDGESTTGHKLVLVP